MDPLLINSDLFSQLSNHQYSMSLGFDTDTLLLLQFLVVIDLVLVSFNSMMDGLHMMDSGLEFSLFNSSDFGSCLVHLFSQFKHLGFLMMSSSLAVLEFSQCLLDVHHLLELSVDSFLSSDLSVVVDSMDLLSSLANLLLEVSNSSRFVHDFGGLLDLRNLLTALGNLLMELGNSSLSSQFPSEPHSLDRLFSRVHFLLHSDHFFSSFFSHFFLLQFLQLLLIVFDKSLLVGKSSLINSSLPSMDLGDVFGHLSKLMMNLFDMFSFVGNVGRSLNTSNSLLENLLLSVESPQLPVSLSLESTSVSSDNSLRLVDLCLQFLHLSVLLLLGQFLVLQNGLDLSLGHLNGSGMCLDVVESTNSSLIGSNSVLEVGNLSCVLLSSWLFSQFLKFISLLLNSVLESLNMLDSSDRSFNLVHIVDHSSHFLSSLNNMSSIPQLSLNLFLLPQLFSELSLQMSSLDFDTCVVDVSLNIGDDLFLLSLGEFLGVFSSMDSLF